MRIIYTKSKWEMWDDSLDEFLQRARNDGFEAVEVYLPAEEYPAREIAQKVRNAGLLLVAQINTEGGSPAEHLESLKRRFEFAAETEPLLVNSHTGRDIFSFDDNLRIFEQAIELSQQSGLLFTQETHRSRPTFAATETAKYLKALPELKLNADFSHWFCVHESDLSDQPQNVAQAIERSWHVHARVGFEEGPQITDPSAEIWRKTVDTFISLWQRIVDARRADGAEFLTITPEFGPPPYMPVNPENRTGLADAWDVNVRFRNELLKRLN